MLTIVLTWATLLWVLAALGALWAGYSVYACFNIAVRFWHNRKHTRSDWAFASGLVKPGYRPLMWLVVKVLRLPTPSRAWEWVRSRGRALWTR